MLFRSPAAVFIALAASLAAAQETPRPILWQCALLPAARALQCFEAPHAAALEQASVRLDPLPPGYRNDLLAGGGPRTIARLVRASPGDYGGRVWNVPLFSHPIEPANARELALAVMCGRDPQCDVVIRR